MQKPNTWIVKLGGSLLGSKSLALWLSVVAELGKKHRVILVPGGGPFAEAVRKAQSTYGLSEQTAHNMAIYAMHSVAEIVMQLGNQSFHKNNLLGLERSTEKEGISVWVPETSELEQSGLPQSWQVTSDSIALWLCGRLNAQGLVLIKSVSAQQIRGDEGDFGVPNYVDDYFPRLAATSGQRIFALGPGEQGKLCTIFSEQRPDV